MMGVKFSVVAGLLAFALVGCSVRMIDFTIISTKNVDLSKAGSFTRAKDRAVGEDLVHIIIIIPTGVPNMKEATDRAIESVKGGVALVDGVLYSKAWWILYGQQSYVIEGTPLVDPALAAQDPLPANHIVCQIDKKGEVEKVSYVTKEEYGKVRKDAGLN
jgi:hypothetical protein